MARPLDDGDLAALARAQPLLLLFDIDGTLAPIVAHPDDARVPADTAVTLETLARMPGVRVAFVTGRAVADARRLIDLPGAWLVGNHGAETRDADGDVVVHVEVAAYAAALRAAVDRLRVALADVPDAAVEDKALSVTVHYRRVARERVPEVAAAVDRVADELGLARRSGKEVLELRAPVAVDKGTAVRALIERLGGREPDAAVVFAGDDVTDEDAFVALNALRPDAMTIRVGALSEPTAARYVVNDPAALAALLERLWAARR